MKASDMKQVVIQVNGKSIHLWLGGTLQAWSKQNDSDADLWDFQLEELLDGTVEIDETIWYWLIDGRCYETDEVVK